MKIEIEVLGRRYEVDWRRPVELAIPLDFHGDQPRAFGLERAMSQPVEAGGFVGDTRRGGSANCESLEMTPHANGTHTECVGHLTRERIWVGDAVSEPLLAATLLTVRLTSFADTDDVYRGVSDSSDLVVCSAALDQSYENLQPPEGFSTAVIVRLEADFEPLADHSGTNPPYFTDEAIRWLRQKSCEHLLVELPSIDRESDGGILPNHHFFFGVYPDKRADAQARRRTVTEMITVPADAVDGPYALSLRFPRFQLDAAPSRPVIYSVATRG